MDGGRSNVPRTATETELRSPDIVAVERMLREGRLAEAERQCRGILAGQETDGRALYLLSEAQRRLGQLGPALQSIEQALAVAPSDALAHCQRGIILRSLRRFDQAVESHHNAIVLKPDYAEAYNNLGSCLRDLKRPREAAAFYTKAIEIRQSYAQAYSNLGVALTEAGKPADAVDACRKAIALKPRFANSHFALGNALLALGRRVEAAKSYQRSFALRPDYVEAINAYANVLRLLGRSEEARACHERALKLAPDSVEALNGLGVVLAEAQLHAEAIHHLEKAVRLRPSYFQAHSNLGAALRGAGRAAEAVASLRTAISINGAYAGAYSNLGLALRATGGLEEAVACHHRAIALQPHYPEAYNNLGVTLRDAERFTEAIAAFRRAIALQPHYPEAEFNLATTLLLVGELQEGWLHYEIRWKLPFDPKNQVDKRPDIPAPVWEGQPLDGKTILVHAEQGFGDTIQFCRYLPVLAARGAKVVFLAPQVLRRLLRPLDPRVQVVHGVDRSAPFDYCAPLMSLPRLCGATLANIHSPVGYLAAEPEIQRSWRARITEQGFRVGICWQGNPRARVDEGRSIALAQFSRLAAIPGVRLISLQKNHGLDQLDHLPAGMAIETLGDGFDAGGDAFVDSAAVISELDLVITSDTAIAHLAGALGRPVWVLLSARPDWRWFLGRNDSPWYPTMQLYRQKTWGSWEEPLNAAAASLAVLAREPETRPR
jgi:tetratricopeptide (TPR) repeat protein